MKTEDNLRNEITDILSRGIHYSGQTGTVVIHGAIDELIKLIHRQEKAAYDLATDVCANVMKQLVK